MNIKYTIEFYTDWHCGSGLAKGADLDALVVKDKDGMPYVPGKTIKGLIREAVEELMFLEDGEHLSDNNSNFLVKTFGNAVDRNAKNDVSDYECMEKGTAFFTNAVLSELEQNAIVSNKAQEFMYRSLANTCIDKDGTASKHSLRKMEVTVPCTLHGEILGVPEGMYDTLKDAMKFIKRLGQNRNRGLGRCSFTNITKEEE